MRKEGKASAGQGVACFCIAAQELRDERQSRSGEGKGQPRRGAQAVRAGGPRRQPQHHPHHGGSGIGAGQSAHSPPSGANPVLSSGPQRGARSVALVLIQTRPVRAR